MRGTESKQRRIFSEAFRREKVKELETNEITVLQLSRTYEVSRAAIYKWIKRYGTLKSKGERMVVEKESEGNKTLKLLEKVKDLERLLGQKQVEIEYLKKIIESESEEKGYDLKKNTGSKC